jgi:hypothetical protein
MAWAKTIDFADLPVTENIIIEQGRTYEERYDVDLSIEGADASDVDFSEATTAHVRIRDGDGDITAIDLTEADDSGNLTMFLTATETDALVAGSGTWEMVFVFPDGSTSFADGATFTLFRGDCHIIEMLDAS